MTPWIRSDDVLTLSDYGALLAGALVIAGAAVATGLAGGLVAAGVVLFVLAWAAAS